MALSRSGPAALSMTCSTVVAPRSVGSDHTGHARFLRARCMCASWTWWPVRPLFHVQVQSDQREGKRDRLGRCIRTLGGERVDDMLVNERRIRVGEGIPAQFVVRLAR